MTLWSGSFPIGARTTDGRVIGQLTLARALPLPLMIVETGLPIGTVETVSFTSSEVMVAGTIADTELGRRLYARSNRATSRGWPVESSFYVGPDLATIATHVATSEAPGYMRAGDTVMIGELVGVTLTQQPAWADQRPIRVWNE